MRKVAPTTQTRPVRVVIADDHAPFTLALEVLFESDGRVEVVGCAGNGEEAVERTLALSPDVTLMDISMPIMDGLEATRRIRQAETGSTVLMLSGSGSASDLAEARRVGAAGYVTKDRIEGDLVEAILGVAAR